LGEAKARGEFQGISISSTLKITHLLFVDDVLIFCNGHRGDADKIKLDFRSLWEGYMDADK
jgi:hypothetical protein